MPSTDTEQPGSVRAAEGACDSFISQMKSADGTKNVTCMILVSARQLDPKASEVRTRYLQLVRIVRTGLSRLGDVFSVGTRPALYRDLTRICSPYNEHCM